MAGRISTLLNNAITNLMNLKAEVDALDRQADLTENRNQNRAVPQEAAPKAPAAPQARALPVGKPPTVAELQAQKAAKEAPAPEPKKTTKKGKKA